MPKKRHRAPRGPGKSEILNVRVKPLTKAALMQAAEKSGRTLSAECEHQISRALFELKAGPTRSVLNAVGHAVDQLVQMRTSTPEGWIKNADLFDAVMRAFVASLEMFRPAAPSAGTAEGDELAATQGRALLLELLAEIAALPDLPLEKLSVRQRQLTMIKADLGDDLLTRPPFRELFNTKRLPGSGGYTVSSAILTALAAYEAIKRAEQQ